VSKSTLQLIDELATDLRPVRVIPPLWLGVSGVLAAAFATAVIVLVTHGAKPGLWDALATVQFSGVLAGLFVVGVGGCIAGLASAVPGREDIVRLAAAVAVAGLLGSVRAVAPDVSWSSARLEPVDLQCVGIGLLLAVGPIAAVLAIAFRGTTVRPRVTATMTVMGASALGALVMHLICPLSDARHFLFSHCLTPVALGVLGVAVLSPVIRRWAR
jgi:hypothetical protein